MHKTPAKVFAEIAQERPACERNAVLHDHRCQGRSTMEHVWVHAGRQIPDKWAVIRLCAWAHSVDEFQNGGGLDKEKNQYLSLLHATDEDLAWYPGVDWRQKRKYLNAKYGKR